MKLLLAGPGTGKTTKIKEIVQACKDVSRVLVLSFTNATINDLLTSFSEANIDITKNNCLTLHKSSLRLNYQKDLHILNNTEEDILTSYAKKFNVHFNDLCRTFCCITFEQMITQTIAYIKSNPVYLKDLIGEIELLVVDEYQDFNSVERELISLIAQNSKDAVILGDDDQCIYKFKDADTDGIINLYNDKAVENLQHHNTCYRCPDCIIDACTSLIERNQRCIIKKWIKNAKTGHLDFHQIRTQDETANFIIEEIISTKILEPQSSIMILSAVEFAAESIIARLEEKNIQFTNLWSSKIDFEKLKHIWEVRTILGSKKLVNLLFLIYENIKTNKKLLAALNIIISKELDIDPLLDFIEQNNILDHNFLAMVKSGSSLQTIISKNEYLFLEDYLDQAQLENDLENISKLISVPLLFDQNGINVLSIHKSKGLQANHVFIIGTTEGILPNVLRGLDSIEMQRRLLFVGMSRAKNNLHIISTIEWDGKYINKVDKKKFRFDIRSRKYHGRASTFIPELNLPK